MTPSANARVAIVVIVLSLIATAGALANFSGTDVFIPSLGRGSGASNSQWNACIWVHNPGTSPVNVTFRLLLRDQPNPSPQVFNDTIPAGDTRRYDDVFATLFGVTTKTFGAVRVTTPAGQPVIVNARSYSTPPGGDAMDTTGQFYAAIPASFAIGSAQKTQLLGVYQTTPQTDSEFRYNYGFVETTGNQVTVQVTAFDPNGTSVGSTSYTLGGYEARQYAITDMLPQVNATNLRLEVAVTSGPGQVVAFGSGIANRSNDPSTFEMSFRDELLAANNPTGLTSVAHDGTLTGNGTTATPLGIANGGVTKAKVAASGGSAGQVLGTDGTSLVWQNAVSGELSLPFSGTVSSNADALAISNTGAGIGIEGSCAKGAAIYGHTEALNGVGVWGRATNGYGVGGGSTTSYGVYGESENSVGVGGATDGVGPAIRAIAYGNGDILTGLHYQTPVFRVNASGKGFFNGGTQTGGADVAEFIDATTSLEPGDVVEIDAQRPGKFRLAASPNSVRVAGVISRDPGITMGATDAAGGTPADGPRLALVGRVAVKVSAENGIIRPGDLLVASGTPGHAMRASANPASGTVVGKALGTLDRGNGLIEMLVMLR